MKYRVALHRRKASFFRRKTVLRRARRDPQRSALAFAWHANKPHFAGCLSGGGETRKLAARARRAALVMIGPRTTERPCTGERPLTLSVRPWFDVRVVTSNAQLAFAWHANKRHCASCCSGGGVTRQLAARARHATLVVIGLRTIEGYCTGGRPLSLGARPWRDV